MKSKRILAVVLAIAMVFGVVSMASAATAVVGGFADSAEHQQANEIAYLRALGIAKGDNLGNFNPDSLLTRQEFVTFVARLAGQEAAAEFMAGIPTRYLDDKDIADWARGAVNLADTNGWVQGYDDGKFHPNDNLTFAQAITVLVRVLGHEPQVVGGYPNGYIISAINLKMNAGVSLSANTPITRGDMGRLLYNSLFIPQAKRTADGWENGDTLMHNRTATGVVQAVSNTHITVEGLGQRALADEVTLIGNVSSLGALQGLNVRVTSAGNITNATAKVSVIEVTSASATDVLVYKEFKTVNDASTGFQPKTFLFFTDGSKIEYDADTTYTVNGSAVLKPGTDAPTGADKVPHFTDLLNEGDWVVVSETGGVAKHLQITSWTDYGDINAQLDKDGAAQTEATNKDRIELVGGGVVATAGATIVLDGAAVAVTDLKKGDVVSVAYKADWLLVDDKNNADPADDEWDIALVEDGDGDNVAFRIEAVRNVIEGEVVKIVTAGTKTTRTLKLADGSNLELVDAAGINGAANAAIGAKVKALLDAEGNVAYYVTVTAPEAAIKYVRAGGITTTQEVGKDPVYSLRVDRGGETEDIVLTGTKTIGTTDYDMSDDAERAAFAAAVLNGYWSISADGKTYTRIDVNGKEGYIVAIDAANGTVTLREDGGGTLTMTVDGFASYKANGTFVKFEDLKVSTTTKVTYYTVADGVALIILP